MTRAAANLPGPWPARIKQGPWGILAILLGFIGFNVAFNPYFATAYNLSNLVQQSAALLLVSIGQCFVIIGGGFDFSVGGVVSLTTCMVATLMQNSPGSYLLVSALVLAVGCLIGLVNGLGVAFFRINPFIMTIGTMSMAKGLAFAFREYPGGHVPPQFIKFMTGQIGPLPTPLVIMALAAAAGLFVFRMSRFGRHVYAVGGAEASAKASGIKVNRIKIATFILSGFTAALGGLFMSARIASGDPRIGESFPLDSITAVVLGGVVIGGGRGSLAGVIAGTILLIVLSNMLTLFDVSPYYHYIVKGVLLGLAVAVTFRKEIREYF